MRAIGIILAGGNSKRLKELSRRRAVCAMPVAGSYRSIDFALSNMEYSRIQKVAVLAQYNSRSLNEHLASSKWWNFGRKQGGLFLFTPSFADADSNWYRGTADAMAQNIHYLKTSHSDLSCRQTGGYYGRGQGNAGELQCGTIRHRQHG